VLFNDLIKTNTYVNFSSFMSVG